MDAGLQLRTSASGIELQDTDDVCCLNWVSETHFLFSREKQGPPQDIQEWHKTFLSAKSGCTWWFLILTRQEKLSQTPGVKTTITTCKKHSHLPDIPLNTKTEVAFSQYSLMPTPCRHLYNQLINLIPANSFPICRMPFKIRSV
jgi:hypothetical protein